MIKLIGTKKTTWGGRRTGAGRPVGTKKAITRKTRSIAAFIQGRSNHKDDNS